MTINQSKDIMRQIAHSQIYLLSFKIKTVIKVTLRNIKTILNTYRLMCAMIWIINSFECNFRMYYFKFNAIPLHPYKVTVCRQFLTCHLFSWTISIPYNFSPPNGINGNSRTINMNILSSIQNFPLS